MPGKNLCEVGGVSLIGRAVRAALESGVIDRTVVSTDCQKIAAEAERHGADVPYLRPAELATDRASSLEVALHALQWEEENRSPVDELVLLQPTSPLRSADDVRLSSASLRDGAPAVVSVVESEAHPWFLSTLLDDGILSPFMPPPEGYWRRQDVPRVYRPNGAVYWIKTSVLLTEKTFMPIGTRAYVMPADRSVDIDTRDDLEFARWLVTRDVSV
ncbi:MAG: acylneuraminate cytidylyltransferase family protein [Fimbriimonadaceae bacterium]|nr:acylneuraminate cytidylyltransferase family protein [Fimbriimonadaceae bacterium]QYK59263.1 MAG: acylneuraminate cytidylyltransferase family protein [Fimbriimonadaceae bacterium]